MTIAGLFLPMPDVEAIGIETAQGLILSEPLYWDLNDSGVGGATRSSCWATGQVLVGADARATSFATGEVGETGEAVRRLPPGQVRSAPFRRVARP